MAGHSEKTALRPLAGKLGNSRLRFGLKGDQNVQAERFKFTKAESTPEDQFNFGVDALGKTIVQPIQKVIQHRLLPIAQGVDKRFHGRKSSRDGLSHPIPLCQTRLDRHKGEVVCVIEQPQIPSKKRRHSLVNPYNYFGSPYRYKIVKTIQTLARK